MNWKKVLSLILSFSMMLSLATPAYALEPASNGKMKLKKYTVNVTGFVVDGKGYGQATCKKPAGGPWAVTVR